MKVLTYNIMNAGKDLFPSKTSWWFTRTLKQMRMIKSESPDIFCLNESTPLQQLLFFFMKGYRCRGWYTQNPIFFKKSFKCLESKVTLLPRKGKYLRSCTYVWLTGRADLSVACTHLDWPDGTDHHEAQKCKVFSDNLNSLVPFIVCGDFNREHEDFFYLHPSAPSTPTYKNAVIDYVFSEFEPKSCKVLTGYDDLSDHRPLIVEL